MATEDREGVGDEAQKPMALERAGTYLGLGPGDGAPRPTAYAIAPLVAVIVTVVGVLLYRRLSGSQVSPLIVGGLAGFLVSVVANRLERRRPPRPQKPGPTS